MPKFVKFDCAVCLSTTTICIETTMHSDLGMVPFATDVECLATNEYYLKTITPNLTTSVYTGSQPI